MFFFSSPSTGKPRKATMISWKSNTCLLLVSHSGWVWRSKPDKRLPPHLFFFFFHERKSWLAHYLLQYLNSCAVQRREHLAESPREQCLVPTQELSKCEQGRPSQMLGRAKTAQQEISATCADLYQKITWRGVVAPFFFLTLHVNQLLVLSPIFLFAGLALLLCKSYNSLQMLPQTLPVCSFGQWWLLGCLKLAHQNKTRWQ